MRLRFLAPALLLATLTARADTFTIFNASGTFVSGSTLSGTLTLDETTGNFTASTLSISSPDALDFSTPNSKLTNFDTSGRSTVFARSNGNELDLIAAVSTFVDYQGGLLASTTNLLQNISSGVSFSGPQPDDLLVSGSLPPQLPNSPPSPSSPPEPSASPASSAAASSKPKGRGMAPIMPLGYPVQP